MKLQAVSLFTGWALDEYSEYKAKQIKSLGIHLFTFNTIYAWIYLLAFGVWVVFLVKLI